MQGIKKPLLETLKTIQEKGLRKKKKNSQDVSKKQLNFNCDKCHDTGIYKIDDNTYRGCDCIDVGVRIKAIQRLIPERFQGYKISELDPCPTLDISIEKQQNIINLLRDNPLSGYILSGPSGVGKSHLLYSLAQEAIWAGRKCIVTTNSRMIEHFKRIEAKELYDEEEERGRVIDIEEMKMFHGKPCHLFIDEWDKAYTTDWSDHKIYEFVDYAYSNPKAVIISITTNLSQREFQQKWGTSILRKLTEISNLIVITRDKP